MDRAKDTENGVFLRVDAKTAAFSKFQRDQKGGITPYFILIANKLTREPVLAKDDGICYKVALAVI